MIFLLVVFNPLSAHLLFIGSAIEAVHLGNATERRFDASAQNGGERASLQFEKRHWYPRLHHDAHFLGIPSEQTANALDGPVPGPLTHARPLRGRAIAPETHPPNNASVRFS